MLTRDQVVSVYRQVLGREPDEHEIEDQLAGVDNLDDLLRVALDSEEYAEKIRNTTPATGAIQVVKVFHPDLSEWGPRPGTRAEDGISIVGDEGWLFLCGGTNANLGQYVGEVQMEPSWLAGWRGVVDRAWGGGRGSSGGPSSSGNWASPLRCSSCRTSLPSTRSTIRRGWSGSPRDRSSASWPRETCRSATRWRGRARG